ncbi:MAG: hypothetical protein ABI162_10055 [Luteolibacter sp.]
MENIIITILLLAALMIALVVMISEGLIHRKPKAKPEIVTRLDLPPSPMESAALAALEAFFEAPDIAAKAVLVRDSSRVRPMMENYYDFRRHPFPTLGRVSPGRSASFDGTQMVLFEVEPFSGPRYPAAVVWDGHRFAVDWESLSAYGTMDWIDFVESKPATTQTLRAFVSKIPDELKIAGLPEGTSQFRIEHRDDPEPIIAAADEAVAALLTPLTDNLRSPVTLEMTWKPIGPGGTPVASISRLIATGWSQ